MSHFPTAYLPQNLPRLLLISCTPSSRRIKSKFCSPQIQCPCDSCCQEAQGQRLITIPDLNWQLYNSVVVRGVSSLMILSGIMGKDFKKRYPYLLSVCCILFYSCVAATVIPLLTDTGVIHKFHYAILYRFLGWRYDICWYRKAWPDVIFNLI